MMEELTRFVYTAFLALNFLPLSVEMTSTFQGQGTFYMGELPSAWGIRATSEFPAVGAMALLIKPRTQFCV